MTNSKLLMIAGGVTATLTIIGVSVAAALDQALVPIIAGVGTTLSAILSHELVKAVIMKIVTYLTTPVAAASIELQQRLNTRPHHTRTLIFSSHESSRNAAGHRVVSNIEGKIEQTIEEVTPPSSARGTYITANSGSESSNESAKENKSPHHILTVD